MPYKNPERKRQWEREHRDQRNARRRQIRSGTEGRTATALTSDPISTKAATSGWKVLASIVVGIGVVLLTVVAGASGVGTGMPWSGQK